MSDQKKQTSQKRVLDVLKEQLQPLTESEGESLTGGVASGTANPDDIDPTLNVGCGEKNSGCPTNTVSGCGK